MGFVSPKIGKMSDGVAGTIVDAGEESLDRRIWAAAIAPHDSWLPCTDTPKSKTRERGRGLPELSAAPSMPPARQGRLEGRKGIPYTQDEPLGKMLIIARQNDRKGVSD